MKGQPPPVTPTPAKLSGRAVASLVLGILGLTCILPGIGQILALVFGFMGLNEVSKSQGRLRGQGQAVAGLIMGGVGLIVVPIAVVIMLPAVAQARYKAMEVSCMNNVKQIGLMCAMYAQDNDNNLPRSLDDLKPYIGRSTQVFICPAAKDKTQPSYRFTGVATKFGDPSNVVILTETSTNHHRRRVMLFNDGHVESRRVSE